MVIQRSIICLFSAALAGVVATSHPALGGERGTTHRRGAAHRSDGDDSSDTGLPKPPRPQPIDGGGAAEKPSPPLPSRTSPKDPPVAPPTAPLETHEPAPVTPGSAPPIDRMAVRRGARQFRLLIDQRRVHLLNDPRDRAQIESLCTDGAFHWPPPPAPKRGRVAPETPVSDPATGQSSTARDSARAASVRTVRAEPAPPDPSEGDAAMPDVAAPDRTPKPLSVSYATEPPAALFQMLNALAANSTEDKPLSIASLLRPPYRTARYWMQSPSNPHALGIAVDIAAFGGHAITTQDPEEEVQAFLSLLKALPPGRYRMGLPKAPDIRPADKALTAPDDHGGDASFDTEGSDIAKPRTRSSLPSRGTRRQDGVRRGSPPPTPSAADPQVTGEPTPVAPNASTWPFFPPPQRGTDAQGKVATLFANEHYALEQYLNDVRLKKALADARRRGVDVFAVFPDGVNHIHVDVKQTP